MGPAELGREKRQCSHSHCPYRACLAPWQHSTNIKEGRTPHVSFWALA